MSAAQAPNPNNATSIDGLYSLNGDGDVSGLALAEYSQSGLALAQSQSTVYDAPKAVVTMPSAFTTPAIQSGPTKLFVGSVPAGTTQQMLHDEFASFGPVAEVFLKSDATEPGRMWGFVTYVNPDGAASAVAALNDQYVFPGAVRPLAVSFARSSGAGQGDGNRTMSTLAVAAAANPSIAPAAASMAGPTKLFIGSIPAGTTKEALKAEFERYGVVMDVFLKNDQSEPHRMWGFVTYQDAASAAASVNALHERLVLPGGSRPCAVSFARNSQAQHSMAAASLSQVTVNPNLGQTKLFIGTIPVGTTEAMLRQEFEKYGQVTEIFLKNDGTDSQRMWGFLSYADPQSAAVAVSSLHEKLMLPGSMRPCAVSFARTTASGPLAGEESHFTSSVPFGGIPLGGHALWDTAATPGQPPPPPGPPPQLADWRVYYTAQGLPYYHNHSTGVTQWECPLELGGTPAGVAGLLAAQGSANSLGCMGVGAVPTGQEVAGQQQGCYAAARYVGGANPIHITDACGGGGGQTLRYSPY